MRFHRPQLRRSILSYVALVLLGAGTLAFSLTALNLDWQAYIGAIVAVMAVLCSVVGLLAAGYIFVTARGDEGSIHQIAEGAARLAQGESGVRVSSMNSPSSPTRARELAEAFNHMSTVIDERVRDLEAQRHQMAVAIDTMADGVIVIDAESRITLLNRAAEWLLGVNAQTALERPLAQVVRDHEILRLASEAARTQEMRSADIDLLHQRRFLNVISTPVSGHDRHDVLLTLRDVTRLRQIETTRREFVSNVSHELRSPLASANAMIEVLEAGAIDDTELAYDFLERIRGDIARMTTLVEELLELSSLQSGQVPVHLAPISLDDVVEEIVERFGFTASASQIELVACLPPDLPYVMGEERKLDQVLTNLVENALRFTPDGGRITLAAKADAQWINLIVSDTGVGIPREHLPHVFERFYKVDRSRSEHGTGLGLAISKHLVQAHGGELSATSVEGEGSEFTVKLRRAT